MESRIASASSSGCGRPIFLVLGLLAVDFLVIAGLVAIAILSPFSQDDRALLIGIGIFLDISMSIVIALVWGMNERNRRLNPLNEAFNALGFTRQGLLKGGGFTGQYRGRLVNAYLARGPRFDLYLEAGTKTRLTVGTRERLATTLNRLSNTPRLTLDDPVYQSLNIYPADENWSREFLSDPSAQEAIRDLTTPQSPYELRYFVIQPGAAALRIHYLSPFSITRDVLLTWLDDLLTLARAAESLPPPAQILTATRLERYSRTNRGALVWPTLGLIAAIVVGTLACFGGLIWAVMTVAK